jgi:GNAT superfamily N-acetyltransferase
VHVVAAAARGLAPRQGGRQRAGVPAPRRIRAGCAVAPREEYPALARSRLLRPVDARPVWSITCLFVARPWRRRGVSARLLQAAARLARRRGARIVEGYPTETGPRPAPDVFVFTGLASSFERAGFAEVARRSPSRPIMRRQVRGAADSGMVRTR